MNAHTANTALPYAAYADDGKVICQLDGQPVHVIQTYLKKTHPTVSVEEYRKRFPDAPLLSEAAKKALEKKKAEKEGLRTHMAGVAESAKVVPLHRKKVPDYGIRSADAMKLISHIKKAPEGVSIPVSVFEEHDHQDMVPEVDGEYIWDSSILRDCIAAMDFNIPAYFWGHAGTGKSTAWEQYAANTNRPFVRIQHTANTEESHIVGQMLANESGTYFEPGPLALAMRYGWVYLADEYDFAFPQVLGVYQPVLEGKPLIIKEAPAEWRRIDPHPQFRFVATGNTNGSGDETGLYQGTNLQNAANYSRFGIVTKMNYLDEDDEAQMLAEKAKIPASKAKALVDFANRVRQSYDRAEISNTIGPRELLYAARIGALFGGDFKAGIKRAFINKLPSSSAVPVSELMDRFFA